MKVKDSEILVIDVDFSQVKISMLFEAWYCVRANTYLTAKKSYW